MSAISLITAQILNGAQTRSDKSNAAILMTLATRVVLAAPILDSFPPLSMTPITKSNSMTSMTTAPIPTPQQAGGWHSANTILLVHG